MNISERCELPGMVGGEPFSPQPRLAGIFNFRFSPRHIPNNPWSQPIKKGESNNVILYFEWKFPSTINQHINSKEIWMQ